MTIYLSEAILLIHDIEMLCDWTDKIQKDPEEYGPDVIKVGCQLIYPPDPQSLTLSMTAPENTVSWVSNTIPLPNETFQIDASLFKQKSVFFHPIGTFLANNGFDDSACSESGSYSPWVVNGIDINPNLAPTRGEYGTFVTPPYIGGCASQLNGDRCM